MRFELTTPTLARLCSTPELRPRPWVTPAGPGLRGGHIAEPWGQRKGRFRTVFASPATGRSPGGKATGEGADGQAGLDALRIAEEIRAAIAAGAHPHRSN